MVTKFKILPNTNKRSNMFAKVATFCKICHTVRRSLYKPSTLTILVQIQLAKSFYDS